MAVRAKWKPFGHRLGPDRETQLDAGCGDFFYREATTRLDSGGESFWCCWNEARIETGAMRMEMPRISLVQWSMKRLERIYGMRLVGARG
jgi:hypothetical protein